MKVEIKIDESVIKFDIDNKSVKLSDLIKDFEKVIEKYNKPVFDKKELDDLVNDGFFDKVYMK